MTCIVGVTDGTIVWMGSDSAADDSGIQRLRKEGKVFNPGGRADMVMGAAGDLNIEQALRYGWGLIDPVGDLLEYTVGVVSPAVRERLREANALTTKYGIESMDGCILFGLQGRLFMIDSQFAVLEEDEGYSAVGSGRSEALSALYGICNTPYPAINGGSQKLLIEVALECSERYNTSVRAPFHILSTAE